MKLPIDLPFGKKVNPRYFLALLLRDEKVTAVVFSELTSKLEIIESKEEHFSTRIEDVPEDELLDILDKAISDAETKLPESVQTQEVLFGLPQEWVEQSRIKKHYLVKLKKVSDSFGLKPIGFLVIAEAIVHLLQKEEGAPVSAILVEIGKQQVHVTLLRAGKIIEAKSHEIEESIPQSVDSLLKHFSTEILPSRIIIFDSVHTEKLSQEFISYSWSKSLPFLHAPQVSPLPRGFDAQAVIFGAALQMGFEVLDEGKTEEILTTEDDVPAEVAPLVDKEVAPVHEFHDFGFMKEEDVAHNKIHNVKKETPYVSNVHEPIVNDYTHKIKKDPLVYIAFLIPIVKTIFVTLKGFLFSIRLPKLQRNNMLVVPIGILGIIVLILLAYVFLIKATVTLHLDPKSVEKKEEVTFSTSSPTDVSKKIIASEFVSISEDGTAKTDATGKKEVGDKAKGQVTLFSRLTQDKKFPEGTIVTSSNNLQFTFDTSVSVSSASADASAGPSTARVAVTAKQIGKESNLPSGTKFTVTGFDSSDIIAKNDTAFSGGTKKEITVVSVDDILKLSKDLPKTLEAKATDDIKKQVTGDKDVLPVFLSTSLTKKDTDKKADDEASSVTLQGTVTYQAVSYKKEDLDSFSRQLFNQNQDHMDISSGRFSYQSEVKEKTKTDVITTLTMKASLIPHIDKNKFAKDITGKSEQQTKAIGKNIPQVFDVSVTFSPNIPLLPRVLPRITRNITVTTSENE